MVNKYVSAYPFLNDLNLDQDVKLRLSLHLDRTKKGNNDVYRTPLGSDGKDQIVLKELDKVFQNKSSLINQTLYDMELNNRSKFGPRSIAIPWTQRERKSRISFEADTISSKPFLRYKIPRSTLRPVSLESAVKRLHNDTNSGLPWYTRKGKVKSRIVEDYDKYIKEGYPCILFTRTQEDGKTRDVWGYPIMETARAMRYYIPYLQIERQLSFRAALLGPEIIGKVMCDLVVYAYTNQMVLVSIDFSHFDQSEKERGQEIGFTYYRSAFQKECQPELDVIQYETSHIPLLTPSGIWKGPHGIPSGTPHTNALGSACQFSTAMQLDFVKPELMQVQGDDGVYAVPKGKETELINNFESFGLTVNKDKSDVSSDYCTYLQCLYHIDYINKGIIGGIYPVYRALNRLCFQERWSDFEDYGIKGSDYYSIRALCILENCKHHPLFEDLVKLVAKYDKYSLDFSSQGLSNYVHMLDGTKGAGEILNNQYGDNVKGIYSFESYKLVKSLG